MVTAQDVHLSKDLSAPRISKKSKLLQFSTGKVTKIKNIFQQEPDTFVVESVFQIVFNPVFPGSNPPKCANQLERALQVEDRQHENWTPKKNSRDWVGRRPIQPGRPTRRIVPEGGEKE